MTLWKYFLAGLVAALFWAAIHSLMRWSRRRLNGRHDYLFQPLGYLLWRKFKSKQPTRLL
jgi:hypothetical protein